MVSVFAAGLAANASPASFTLLRAASFSAFSLNLSFDNENGPVAEAEPRPNASLEDVARPIGLRLPLPVALSTIVLTAPRRTLQAPSCFLPWATGTR
jgi:hypothetical protein